MKEPKLVTRRDAEGYPLYEPEGVEALIKSLRTEIEDLREHEKSLLWMSSFVEKKLKSDREALRAELDREIGARKNIEESWMRGELPIGIRCEPLDKCKADLEQAKKELAEWTRPHDDDGLRKMAEQYERDPSSHGAKQAYINALEWHMSNIRKELDRLREALEFYGNHETYERVDILGKCGLSDDFDPAGYGHRARAYLAAHPDPGKEAQP